MSIEAEFADWWYRTGRTLDPDTSDVSWYDKRKGLAEAAFNAAMAIGRNYVCDKECEPTEAHFVNGRRVWIRFNEDEEAFLHIEMALDDIAELSKPTAGALETLAQWMVRNSYATGHGDTMASLLSELEWQIEERIEHKCAIAYASAKS